MNIAFFAKNLTFSYSGGRYHSWIMAEALAHGGHKVFYITDNKPIFTDDFAQYAEHSKIDLFLTSDFHSNLPNGYIDIVVLVPSMTVNSYFFSKTVYFCRKKKAKLVLLNFETPNWYNSLSPTKRPSYYWDNCFFASKYTSLILSSTIESDVFAQQYFKKYSSTLSFDYCYPSINSLVADKVKHIRKEKRILLLARFSHNFHHKGAFGLTEIICEAMRGYTLVALIGSGNIPNDILDELLTATNRHGVFFEVKYRLPDYEKFKEIKRAALMLFPSFFEGFGYPPVESQYCNTPCIAFDLPVLREVSGEGLIYVEPGNWAHFRKKIEETLQTCNNTGHLHDNIKVVASFSNYSKKLDDIFKNILTPEADQFRQINNFTPARFFLASVPNLLRSYFAQIVKNFFHLILAFLKLLCSIAIQPILNVIRPSVRKKLVQLYPEMSWDNLSRDLMILLKKKLSQRLFNS